MSIPPPPPPPPGERATAVAVAPVPYFPPAPAAAVAAAIPQRHGHGRLFALLGGGLGGLVLLFIIIAIVATPHRHVTTCPPYCPHPPVGPAVQAAHTYTSSATGFSVDYTDEGNPSVDATDSGLTLTYSSLDNGVAQFLAVAAHGKSAQQVVEDLVQQNAPNAHAVYQLPGAYVGYEPGYGAAYDLTSNSSSGSASTTRLIVLAAVKKDLAIVTVVHGPYRRFAPDGTNDGHASPAAVVAAFQVDPVINTVRWPGQPAR